MTRLASDRARVAAVFVALALVGVVLRVLAFRSGWIGLDSDEATGDLMALRAAHGHLALLFWGADYGGALLTWVDGLLVHLLGFHLWVIWLVDTLVALGCSLALWSLTRRLLPPVTGAAVAGAFTFFPPLWLFWSGREYVFWSPAILFALISAKFVLDWFERDRAVRAVAAGVAAGLAIWSYPLAAPLVVPPLLALAWGLRRRAALLGLTVAGALAGVSPWAAYFAIHGASAFTTQRTAQGRWESLKLSVDRVLPAALSGGQKRSGLIFAAHAPRGWLLTVIGLFVYFASLVALVAFVLGRRYGLAAAAAAVVLWPLAVMAGHVPVGVPSYRYALIAVPAVLILAGYAFSRLRAGLLIALIALVVTPLIASRETSGFAAQSACLPSVNAEAARLVSEGRAAAWGAYWVASDLTVCGYPHTMVAATAIARDDQAAAAARAAPRSTYVVFDGNVLDHEIAAYVSVHRIDAVRRPAFGLIEWDFPNRVLPAEMHLDGAF